MGISNTSDRRLKEVLSYVDDHSRDDALEYFDIKPSTIKRYKREARKRDLNVPENYDDPKILVTDLETAPHEAYVWDTGKQYISADNLKADKSLLSYSAKWLCDNEIISNRVTPKQASNRDDKELVEELWDLLNESDLVIGHNFRSFDRKVANTRFIVNNIKPPSTYEIIDTYKHINKEFSFPSHSLDYLTEILCSEDKLDTSMELWERCVNGDEEALEAMETYNRQDVRANEELWFQTRAFYTSGPNLATYYDDVGNRCPRCGSKNLHEGDSKYHTPTAYYRTIRCEDCGGIGRSRFCEIGTEERKKLYRTTAH